MAFEINDYTLMGEILSFKDLLDNKFQKLIELYQAQGFAVKQGLMNPLDTDVMSCLELLRPSKKEKIISYDKGGDLDSLWLMLIEKSIICLRYFDSREPFMKNEKKLPVAYGIENIRNFHKRYVDFERMLYGGANYYRDHVFHAVRTWLLGIFLLLKSELSEDALLLIDMLELDGESKNELFEKTNYLEKISMWTIIALCHDLGYPLEKSQMILQKTNNMMKEFISNPSIWSNYSFSGGQTNINEYVVKYMSTKVKPDGEDGYIGRIQPKYYIKFSKSLESFKHGVVSAIIIYTMLLYFLESDFNLNDDYVFETECARQFYIRREMLRAIAAHTCPDIYSIKISSLTSLLFICDELQEWGRKTWDQIYTGDLSNNIRLEVDKYNCKRVRVSEIVDMPESTDDMVVDYVLRVLEFQYAKYKLVFRDGQYSNKRKFDFEKSMIINMQNDGASKRFINIDMKIMSTDSDNICIDTSNTNLKEPFMKKIIKNENEFLYKDEIVFKDKT